MPYLRCMLALGVAVLWVWPLPPPFPGYIQIYRLSIFFLYQVVNILVYADGVVV